MKNENSDSNSDINGKIVMIACVKSGIGKEIAKTLAKMRFINRTILLNLLV
ncbi:MAG: hypothetical protein KGD68_05515 [Candidatus Lokiarchaeota archaeon]|nr:hypothetical protein [Candidatus Lokiarchaeota archaeon]